MRAKGECAAAGRSPFVIKVKDFDDGQYPGVAQLVARVLWEKRATAAGGRRKEPGFTAAAPLAGRLVRPGNGKSGKAGGQSTLL